MNIVKPALRCVTLAVALALSVAAHESAVAAVPRGAPQYHLVQIEIPGASSVYVAGINDAGQAVGYYIDEKTFENRAFLWNDGIAHTLAIPGDRDEGAATAINNLGQIVGTSSRYTDDGALTTALVWDAGEPEAYAIIGEDQAFKLNPAAINDAGIVVGLASADGQFNAFTWSAAGGVVDNGVPAQGPGAQAFWSGINNSNDIVGGWNFVNGPTHATLGKVGAPGILPIAAGVDDVASKASAINDQGFAVGEMVFGGTRPQPATFANGVAAPIPGALLGLAQGAAYGVNESGVIVGRAYDFATLAFKAFVYVDGQAYDIAVQSDNGNLFEYLLNGVGVNENGVIAGTARGPDFSVASFIAVPAAPDAIFADGFEAP